MSETIKTHRYCTVCAFDFQSGIPHHSCGGTPSFCGDCGHGQHEGMPCSVLMMWDRPGGVPGNGWCMCGRPEIPSTITVTSGPLDVIASLQESNAEINRLRARVSELEAANRKLERELATDRNAFENLKLKATFDRAENEALRSRLNH